MTRPANRKTREQKLLVCPVGAIKSAEGALLMAADQEDSGTAPR